MIVARLALMVRITSSACSMKTTSRTPYPANPILIEIEDECGGLPLGIASINFNSFEPGGVNPSGLGLGLSIARRSIEASGGRLHVRDVPGVGCVFTIDLPAAPPIPEPLSIVA